MSKAPKKRISNGDGVESLDGGRAEIVLALEADSKKNTEFHIFGNDQKADEIVDALNAARARSLKNEEEHPDISPTEATTPT